jgi:hypothetical protein
MQVRFWVTYGPHRNLWWLSLGLRNLFLKTNLPVFTNALLTSNMLQASNGSRHPTEKQIELTTIQGESFGTAVSKVNFLVTAKRGTVAIFD